MDDKLGRKVTLREDSIFANDGVSSNLTGFIGVVCEKYDYGASPWFKVYWESGEFNSYKEGDLLWYDYVDDWKDVVRSWGGSFVE